MENRQDSLEYTRDMRVEQAIRSSELSYRRLFEAAKDGILILDVDTGRIDDVNPFLCKLLGFSRDEMLGKTVGEVSPFRDIESNKDMLEHLQEHGYVRYEDLPLETRDGRHIAVEFVSNVYQVGDRNVIQCNVRDITERKRIEKQLKASFKEIGDLKSAVDQHAIVAITNPQGLITYVNEGFCAISKYSREELLGKDHRITNSGFHPKEFIRKLWVTIASGKVWKGEIKNKAKDGSFYWVDTTIVPFLNEQGQPRQYVAIRTDITARKAAAEQILQVNAALVQFTLENAGIPCAITRVENRHDFVSMLERNDIDLILSDFSLPAFDGISAAKIVRAGWPDLPVIMVSGTLGEELAIDSLKSGATDYVLKERLARLAPAVRRAMQEVEERIERRRLAAQFIEAQKMEVIGQLAGGVAHDFNNILAVVIGYSDLIAADLGADHPLHKYTEEIRHVSERATGLTRQLLVFSRKQTVQPIVLDLNVAVKELSKMLRRLIDENIDMTVIPEKEIGRIKADSGYIGQVLLNLVINARDAMPNGGKLTIATSNVTLDENDTRTGAIPGDYVMLSVGDTGTGMTEEVKARMFEAFFTTKPSGKGTGLGLATCQTIVQQSGGHIDVSSAVGKGTTFKIYFPRVEQPLDAAFASLRSGPLPRGTETVLVVEDEPSLRNLACDILESQGYEVLSASNGHDALHVAQEHKGSPIQLVLTDVIMPLMGGKTMAEFMKTQYSGLKFLFTSGYSDEAITHHGEIDAGVEFLPKPYTPATLAYKVREILDATHGQPTALNQGK